MRGKEKCRALKEIRKQIAEKNDIEYVVSECSHQGECKGTCPKCEAELRFLERELERKKNLGKAVCVVGISASVCTGLTACNPIETINDFADNAMKKLGIMEEEMDGAIAAPELMGDMPITPEATKTPVEGMDGDIALPEVMQLPEEAELMGELPLETLAPEDGEEASLELPLKEVLEGDVAIIEGGIMQAPQE